MKDYKSYFKGKKVTVVGLGLLGRGVGDVAMLAECGALLTVTDLKTKEQLKESLAKLKKFKNIKYVLGAHQLADFQTCDMVLKAAGVPLDSIYIKEARKHGIPVEMSATLFAEFSGMPMIAVTGTRGKSTVTHLLAHILESAGKKIVLGGNVRGVSNLQLLKKSKGKEFAVFELDSWQLQGFGDKKISPQICAFTTFYPDHMSYYGGDMKKYFSDKANIFKYQGKGDTLVTSKQVLGFIKKWKFTPKSNLIVSKNTLPKAWKMGIPGKHNIENATLALEVARKIGIRDEVIKKALQNFKGVPGRLQLVREVRGVKYYNDTTATTPEATIAAIQALAGSDAKKRIILIMGGSDKGLSMKALWPYVLKHCKDLYFLAGSGTERIKGEAPNVPIYNSLQSVMKAATSQASKGDIILFSPAFASFGMFKNEYDRGDQFMKIVRSLK